MTEKIRHDGKTVGEITTKNGQRVFLWYQNPLRFYGRNGGFSISEGLLSKIPVDVKTFIVKTKMGEEYIYSRKQFETGEKIPIHDDRFNEAPSEPQYAVPKGEAKEVEA